MSTQRTDAPLQRVLGLLSDVRGGDGQYLASCPAHDDREPSLSIGQGAAGAVLLHCHAGCSTAAVLEQMGIDFADLFPYQGRGTQWLRWHVYRDADGGPLYSVRRGTTSKGERDWRIDGYSAGGWSVGYRGPKVLYNLPTLLRNPTAAVFITEGERDADTLCAIGFVATTVANSSWTGVDTSCLQGRQVWIVVDADPGGWKRGKEAHAAARDAGATVLGVLRPAEGYKDITEQLAAIETVDGWALADLCSEPPLGEVVRRPARSAFRENGLSLYVQAPTGVLLGLVQRGDLRHADALVWLLLEERAGASSEAHLSAAEISRLLRIGRRTVSAALVRLTKVGLAAEICRGHWRVFNPAVGGRQGTIDRSLVYADRDPNHPESRAVVASAPPFPSSSLPNSVPGSSASSPFPPTPSITTPANASDGAIQVPAIVPWNTTGRGPSGMETDTPTPTASGELDSPRLDRPETGWHGELNGPVGSARARSSLDGPSRASVPWTDPRIGCPTRRVNSSPFPPTSFTMTPGSGAQDTTLRGRVGLSATWICEPGGAPSSEDEDEDKAEDEAWV